MDDAAKVPEEQYIWDYMFGIKTKEAIKQVCDLALENPLFAELTLEDKDLLISKFTFIEDNYKLFPGFIFMKIDTMTSMVYVDYRPLKIMEDFIKSELFN